MSKVVPKLLRFDDADNETPKRFKETEGDTEI